LASDASDTIRQKLATIPDPFADTESIP